MGTGIDMVLGKSVYFYQGYTHFDIICIWFLLKMFLISSEEHAKSGASGRSHGVIFSAFY